MDVDALNGQETRTCYECGKKGHLAKDCRTKQQPTPPAGGKADPKGKGKGGKGKKGKKGKRKQ